MDDQHYCRGGFWGGGGGGGGRGVRGVATPPNGLRVTV